MIDTQSMIEEIRNAEPLIEGAMRLLDMYPVWEIDAEGKTTACNPLLAELLGVPVEAIVGTHLFAWMPEDMVPHAQAAIERRRQGIRERHSFTFQNAKGERIDCELLTAPYMQGGVMTGAFAILMPWGM